MASTIERQIEVFASGIASELAFPAELTAQERKLVKITAEKCGLSSCSFGMGDERRIHIFKPTAPKTLALSELVTAPVEYSVKNTFVDGPVTPLSTSPGPAHQSMPVGSLQEHIAAEENLRDTPKDLSTSLLKKLNVMLSKVEDSPRESQSGDSTVDSESEAADPAFSIKNTFVHFESDSDENGDPRIVQSMPNGMFAERVEAEINAQKAAAAVKTSGKQQGRPLPFSEDPEEEDERVSAILFPATPNAETAQLGAFHDSASIPDDRDEFAVPTVQWVPSSSSTPTPCTTLSDSITVLAPAMCSKPASSTKLSDSITVLAPAMWAPSPAQTLLESPAAQLPPQGSTHGSLQGPTAPQPAQMAPPLLPPGTPVVLCGLANQPGFNGLHGFVSGFDADCGRYNIAIEMGPNAQSLVLKKSMVKIKPQNLLLAQAMMPPAPQLPFCSPIQQQQVVLNRPPKASLCLDQML